MVMVYSISDKTLEVIRTATANGDEVITTEPKTPLLDIDNGADLEKFHELFPIAAKLWNLVVVRRWSSKSGNTHIQLYSNIPPSMEARLLIQACLGSDRKRELLGYNLFRIGAHCPSFLIKPKEKKDDK